MQGHIRKRGGSWTIVVNLPRGDDGRRRQLWRSVKGTKKDAEGSSVQPTDAGPDEDSGGDGQPGILDAEVSGGDAGGGGTVPVREHEEGSGEASSPADSEHPASSPGED